MAVRVRGISWNRPLLIAATALSLISLIALRSAAATLNPSLAWKQAIWVVVGLAAGIGVASGSYRRWLDGTVFLYVGSLILLVLVEVAGTEKLGAVRWLTILGFSMQPSEIAKLATACGLARYLGGQPAPLSTRSLVVSGLLMGVPAVLILLQPDLGSASILVAIWLGAICTVGMSKRQVGGLLLGSLLVLPVVWHGLKEYQRARLLVFLNPQTDPLGAGYTIIQSQIAIGSGQLFGRGWMAGTQNQLNFLPERHADFLYSVIGEEWGLVGSLLVIGLFAVIVSQGITIAQRNSEPQGRLLAVALVSWLAYQAVINMGMVMGLVPVVGVPLPLVSYGGSAMLITWIAVGLLCSVQRFGTRF